MVEAAGVEGSSMDARIREDHLVPSTNEVAIDTLELCNEGIKRIQ